MLMKTKYALVAVSGAVFGVASLYLFSVAALWFIYSMSIMVNDGFYTLSEAHSLVGQMASITTALVVVGIVGGRMFLRTVSPARIAIACSLGTGFLLGLYTFLNVLWRNSWEPSSVSNPFFPPGDLNSHFFYEYNWLSYLLFLTPSAMIASGFVSFFFWRLLDLIRSFEPVRATST